MDIEMLRERADVIKKVRSFFNEQGYLETDTPLLAPDLIPESCLEVFETKRLSPGGSLPEPAAEPCSPSVSLRRGSPPEKPYWLIPSPEVWMKRLIAEHRANIFQICKCFRNGESLGYMHNPEFTMLEYYTMETDYLGSLSITEKLFKNLAVPFDLSPPFIKITIEEAFYKWAGFDLYKTAAEGGMEEKARRLKLNPPEGLSAGELYDLIFIHAVEPRLKLEKPVVLLDYPAFVPCLAKKKPGGKTVERWELYAHGIELANCYSEETSAEEVRLFFESEKAKKEKKSLISHNVDDNYWKLFDTGYAGGKGFPKCSGTAMGLDRLIMVLTGRKTLDGVIPFPMVQ